MRVRWTTEAADDLERICDHIAVERPDSARRVAESVVMRIGELDTFPRIGRAGRVAGTRVIAFPPLAYLPLTTPHSCARGSATLSIGTAENGGGCVLFVKDGKLATLEVYTCDDLGRTDQSRVTEIRDVVAPITDGEER
jgi:plasmid stabilization system protein ParE